MTSPQLQTEFDRLHPKPHKPTELNDLGIYIPPKVVEAERNGWPWVAIAYAVAIVLFFVFKFVHV